MLSRKNRKEILFLLTSTTVPYIRDALDLLCLPSGIHYRFRYRKRWLPAEFLTKEGMKKLIGLKALIVHIHTKDEKGKGYKILEFIPLREASIDDVRQLGEFLWIQFILGDWVYYRRPPKAGELNEFHGLLKRHIPQDSREFVNKIMFIVKRFEITTIADDPTGENEEVLRNWTLIASHVGKLEPHQNSIFTKILSIKDMNTKDPLKAKLLNAHVSGYLFNGGHTYSIDIAQFYPQEKDIIPFNVNLVTSTAMTPIKSEAEVKGKYDLLHFILDCKSSEKTINTFLAFRASSPTKYLISEPFFNIRIKGQWHKVALALFTFGIGVVLTNVSAQLVNLTAGNPVNATVVVAVFGTIFSTLGLFLLHRI